MFFQNLAKIEMTQNKDRLFSRHFETVQHLNISLQNCDVLLPVKIDFPIGQFMLPLVMLDANIGSLKSFHTLFNKHLN